MSETKCDDCGLPISVCNARAMLQLAIGRNGIDAVSDAIADLTTLSALQEQNRALREALADPNAVHANMLRGTIAKPSVEQIVHLYGDELYAECVARHHDEVIASAIAATKQEGGE